MPVRFTSPGLGGQRNAFLQAHEWEVGASFRRLTADEWFVGREINEAAAPFGKPLYLDINSLDLSLAYGLTSRASITLTIPFSSGTHSRLYADQVRHKVAARGLGDINAIASVWLRDPGSPSAGNIALGIGLKAPTGNNRVEDDFFAADGSVSRRVVDQAIQLGDGGWGVIVQSQGYRRLSERLNAYAFGSYLVTPKRKTEVPSPLTGVTLSVPDVYSVRAGVAYAHIASRPLTASLGARIDGIPLRDLVGGGDDGFRRPGHTLFLDPGVSLRIGRHELTTSVPIRLRENFSRSLIDRERGLIGGGDLARYLVFAGYTVRL
jgi:hypothetical protein